MPIEASARVRIAGQRLRMLGLLGELGDAATARPPPSRRRRCASSSGTSMHPTVMSAPLSTCAASMRAVIHLVDVIAGQDQHEVRGVAADDVEVLVARHPRCPRTRRSRCAAAPATPRRTRRARRAGNPSRAGCDWISECALYWVSTATWRMPELMQLDSGKSMMRNLPPKGTAGLARQSVSCLQARAAAAGEDQRQRVAGQSADEAGGSVRRHLTVLPGQDRSESSGHATCRL